MFLYANLMVTIQQIQNKPKPEKWMRRRQKGRTCLKWTKKECRKRAKEENNIRITKQPGKKKKRNTMRVHLYLSIIIFKANGPTLSIKRQNGWWVKSKTHHSPVYKWLSSDIRTQRVKVEGMAKVIPHKWKWKES